MSQQLFSILRKTIGIILIVLGIIGSLMPIPLIPFFLLTIAGLGLIGIKPETIDRIKQKFLNKK